MKFSRYNFLFQSQVHGFFIYNSTTNSLHKINEDLYVLFHKIQVNSEDIQRFDDGFLEKLISLKIIVNSNDDDAFIRMKRYIHCSNAFSLKSLGVVIVPTMNCNFACPYCYESDLPKDKMSVEIQEKLIKFIENANGSQNVSICWHGGEPLLAFDVMERILSKLFNSPKIKIHSHDLVTNGYLLDPAKVSVLKKYHLNLIQITIDGLKDIHNISRPLKSGLPTYDKIISNVDYFLNEFPECKVMIRINVHENNKSDFPKLYKELTDRWQKYNCNIYMVYVSDYENCKVKCIKLSERVDFFSDLYKNEGISDVKFYPKYREIGCTATFQNSFIVGVSGELYKCWVDVGKPEKVIGSLDKPFENVSLLSDYIIGSDMFNDPKCSKCFLFPVCDGGCNIRRLENRDNGKENSMCPIDVKDMAKVLELHYEQIKS